MIPMADLALVVAKPAENQSKPVLTGRMRGLRPGRCPTNTGGKKGRSGRKPKTVINLNTAIQEKFADIRVAKAIEAVITNPDHPQFAQTMKMCMDRVYGKPVETVNSTVDNRIEIVMKHAIERTG
jgi:hypothetical protein